LVKLFNLFPSPNRSSGSYENPFVWLNEEPENGTIKELVPAETLHRTLPKDIYQQTHPALLAARRFINAPVYGIKGNDLRFWTTSTRQDLIFTQALISHAGRLVGELSYGFGDQRKLSQHKIFEQIRLPQPPTLPGHTLVLTSIKGGMFFHWMLDLLPKLGLLKKMNMRIEDFDHILVNHLRSPFMEESLNKLGVPLKKIISSLDYPYVKMERATLFSPICWAANPSKWILDWLKENLGKPAERDKIYPRHIYISRSKAKVRRLVNEGEVVEALKPFGFEVLTLEDLPLEEQIQHFSHAETIIAPHGAGLTLTAFCSPGTQLIEIFSPHYFNPCFYSMASLKEMQYSYILCEGQALTDHKKQTLANMDMKVEVEKLLAALSLRVSV